MVASPSMRVALGSWGGIGALALLGVIVACVGEEPMPVASNQDGAAAAPPESDSGADEHDAASPVPFVDVGVGYGFACAALADGEVACWGASDHGQTGRPPSGET